ncbi:MAG: hypothetical protein ACERKD_04880 [Prolixibacteraceae bacterium]
MNNKKKIRIPVIICLTAITIIAGIHFGIQSWLNQQLPLLLNEHPERKYNISYDKAHLHLLKQNLIIDNVSIIELADSINPSYIQIDKLKAYHLQLRKLFVNKEIETHDLIVVHPVFNIVVHQNTTEQNKEKMNEIWTDVFTRLSIKNFEITNAAFRLMRDQDLEPTLQMDQLNLKINTFNIDTTTLKNPFPLKFSSLNASCSSTQIRIDTIGFLKIKKIILTDHSIQLQQSSFQPLLTKSEFIDVQRDKDNWLSFNMDQLILNNFSWAFDSSGTPFIKASSFQLDSIVLQSVTDKQFLRQHKGYRPLLAEIFRSLPVKFQLDSFRVLNSAVFAETRPINNNTTAKASFDNLYISGYNLHNISKLTRNTEFDILCRFMNEAKLEAHYVMNVNDNQDRFRINGSLNNLTTESVNRILQPLADIETAGQLYGIDFDVLADNYQSTGTVDFEYNNLKILVRNKNKDSKNSLLTALSNLALRGSNVRSNRSFRQGEIQLARDQNKSIFGYIWDSVKDGLTNTLIPFNLDQNRPVLRRKKKLKN